MKLLRRHLPRIAVTLLPLLFALLHAVGVVHLDVLQRLDEIIYDARLRASPRGMDARVVIVDIDEKSLAEVGRWPWGRNRMAELVNVLFDKQHIALLGMDVVFAEPDASSGLPILNELAQRELRDQPAFLQRLQQLQPALDYDALFAKALQGRPVVLGYYVSEGTGSRTGGVLPAPVITAEDLHGRSIQSTNWSGYGANIAVLAHAAPAAGFFDPLTDGDGVVRSLPMLAEFGGQYYESLSLAMLRLLAGSPKVEPGFVDGNPSSPEYREIDRIILRKDGKSFSIPVDPRAAMLIPYRGPGGPTGGSFRYVSASDLLAGRTAPDSLRDKIVLIGTTAPGLLDMRVTPVSETYPGVEAHANLISGMLDRYLLSKPDYAPGYDVLVLLLAGSLLAFGLPFLSAPRAVVLNLLVIGAITGANFWFYYQYGLVLPLACALAMSVAAFALNMSFGYFVESRSKRELANLFGTYVPPELVDEMVKDPDAYSMQATSREMTVMFCDMRGFTEMSETMEPTRLQELLNSVFSRLSGLIRAQRGTIDKFMGDCVMAFWGAPVDNNDHATQAVQTALKMLHAVGEINQEHAARGWPQIGVGIGINSGNMCVGDMGSSVRRAYTVIGDAVNLGSRLEGLSKVYGVEIVASESTRERASGLVWQELDAVRVKGKAQAVRIFTPCGLEGSVSAELTQELALWANCLTAYRSQQWQETQKMLETLTAMSPRKYLYRLYTERLATMRDAPPDSRWDGATNFVTK